MQNRTIYLKRSIALKKVTKWADNKNQACLYRSSKVFAAQTGVKENYLQSGGELNHLFGLDVLEAIDTGNTVTNAQDASCKNNTILH